MLKEGLRTMVFPEGSVTFNLKLNGRRRYSHTLYLLDGGSAMIESPRGSSLEQLARARTVGANRSTGTPARRRRPPRPRDMRPGRKRPTFRRGSASWGNSFP